MVPEPEVTARHEPELPKVPGYRLEKVIGRGATGVVYRAVQLAVDRPVALKILHKELVGTKRAVRRLQREARTAARLSHAAIISAIDMGEVGGQWWFAMELVEGISLAQRLRDKGPLTEREALRLFLPLCDGLQHAYEQSVVHRDIKPANILIDTKGRARLVDLGLAFAESDPMLTSGGGTLGTPHYISPEQARDPANADARSDIWSLGATIFHALTGQPPFEGESVAEILSSVLYRPVVDPRSLAPELSKGMGLVLRKCLSRAPERRYQKPAELAADLERLRANRAPRVRARSLDPLASLAPAWVAPLGWGAGALVLAVLVWLVVRASDSETEKNAGQETAVVPEWPELTEIEASLEHGDISLAAAIARLEAMQIPAELDLKQRQNAVLTGAKKRLEGVLDEFWLEARTTLEEHLGRSDYERAAEWVKSGIPAELERRTGYATPKDLPSTRMLRDTRALEGFELQIGERRQAALENARQRLAEHVNNSVLPELEKEREGARWLAASAVLDRAVTGWLDEHPEHVTGLNEPELKELAKSVAPRIELERARIREEVERANAALEAELPLLVDDLRDDLRAGGRDVGALLTDAFRASLERRGLDLEQVPEGMAFPAREHFEAAVAELRAAERAQVVQDARLGFEEAEGEAAELMRARHYADAAALWRSKLEQAFLEPERARIELRVRECEILQSLLESVATRVRELDGRPLDLYRSSTISEEGTIDAGPDPLVRGFEHIEQVSGRRHRYRLDRPAVPSSEETTLSGSDLEVLANLPPRTDLKGHLLLALLRFHEGEYKAAEEAFPAAHASDDPLYADLGARIDSASRAESMQVAERRDQLDFQMRQIKRFSEKGQDRDALKEINRTLGRFQDLLAEDEAKWLRAQEEILLHRGAPLTLQRAYAPDELSHPPGKPRAFLMLWNFDAEEEFAWKRGLWKFDGQGWCSPRLLGSDDELFDVDSAPELLLVAPIDLTEDLRLHLVLERLDAEVQTQTIVLSCAGFHLALLVDGTRGNWLLDITNPEDVLDRLRAAPAKAGSFTPPPPHTAFPLELSVNPKLGEVRGLEIGGLRLSPPTFARRPSDDRRIEVRARERILLLQAELAGKELER